MFHQVLWGEDSSAPFPLRVPSDVGKILTSPLDPDPDPDPVLGPVPAGEPEHHDRFDEVNPGGVVDGLGGVPQLRQPVVTGKVPAERGLSQVTTVQSWTLPRVPHCTPPYPQPLNTFPSKKSSF